jgi:hypothetical protein
MPKKTLATKPKPSKPQATRRLRVPRYKSFRLDKRIKHPKPPLPSSFKLFKRSVKLLFGHWKLFGGIVLVYALLSILLVGGLGSNTNIGLIKESLQEVFHGTGGHLQTGVTLFGVLLATAGRTSSGAAGAYQFMLFIIVSLAVIWALRHVVEGTSVGVRDAFYKGLYPLAPFVLVLLVVGLQLLPLAIGSVLYDAANSGQLVAGALEQFLWLLLFALLAIWSLFMVAASVFALYIVTLPDIRPLQALRSAKNLVRLRRWTVMRKLLFLPLALVLTAALIMVPVVLVLTPLAQWIFAVLMMVGLMLVHSYVYSLYRELIA